MLAPCDLTLVKKLETWKKNITADYIFLKKPGASLIKRLRAVIDAGGGHIDGIRDALDDHVGTDDDSD